MARTRTLAQLRDDVLKRADRENASARFPPSEVNEYINQSIADLYDQICAARGRAFFRATTAPFPCDGTTTIFPFPGQFYELLGVRLDLGSGQSIELESFTPLEEAELLSSPTNCSFRIPKYSLYGDNIQLLPVQSTGKNLYVDYIQASVRLVSDGDTFDGYGGWEEFVILDAARKVATKDSNWELVNSLRADIQVMRTRVQGMASKRDRGRPERVQDVRGLRRFSRRAWRRGV